MTLIATNAPIVRKSANLRARRGNELVAMGADGEKCRLSEPFPALLVDEAHDFPAHARVPKAFQMTGHRFERRVAIGLRLEERSDLVDHLDQLVRVHVVVSSPRLANARYERAGPGRSSPWTRCVSPNFFCQAEGSAARLT